MMRRRITNMALLPLAAVLFLLATVISSCERKPLYLMTTAPSDLTISVYDIKLELLWGLDWRAQWQYDWDSTLYGPVGYTEPEWVRATIYNREGEEGKRSSFFTRNFTKEGGRVSLNTASWYDMLFYNSGTEYILFNPAADNSTYQVSTRPSSLTSYSRSFLRSLPDYNQPDELFGVMLDKMYVSDNPDDYEVIREEDGTIVYLYKVDAELRPYTFIYLVQVMLLHNSDSIGTRITGCDGLTVGGLAQGAELFSRMTSVSEVNISSEDIKPMQQNRMLTLPNGDKAVGDVFATRMLSWGLPDMVPLATRGTRASSNGNQIGLGLHLRNGITYSITRDITEQMETHPTGGIITVVLDTEELPDSIFRPKPPTPGGSGFNASVQNWSNEFNAEIEI